MIYQQAKVACFNLNISGHELAASSKCLYLLIYLWDFKEMGFSHGALSKQLRYQSTFFALNFGGSSSDFREEPRVNVLTFSARCFCKPKFA